MSKSGIPIPGSSAWILSVAHLREDLYHLVTILVGDRYRWSYEPNFVVETRTVKFLCEPKAATEMTVEDVMAKAQAAAEWCAHATAHEKQHGGKPWTYLFIPHDSIADNKTLQGMVATYTYGGVTGGIR